MAVHYESPVHLAVLNPKGRDPHIDYRNGPESFNSEVHAPINFHAYAASTMGAFFDSTMDRITDALLFGGMAWFLVGQDEPRLALLPFAVSAVASLISYQRAKAESLGIDAKGGLMERAERIVALCIGLLLEGVGLDGALVWILWVMLALIIITAVQRFVKVWTAAEVSDATQQKIDDRRERRVERRTARRAHPRERVTVPRRRGGIR